LFFHFVLGIDLIIFDSVFPYSLLLFLLLFFIIVLPVLIYNELKYKNLTYEITSTNLVYRFGIINLKKVIIPLARLQNVSYNRSFFERIFGLVTIEIETAGSKMGVPECIISGIESHKRKDFVNELFGYIHSAKIDGLENNITDSMRMENTLIEIVNVLKDIKKELKEEKTNPMIFKKQLALEITKQIHGLEKAKKAQQFFEKTFQQRKTPEKIPLLKIGSFPTPLNKIINLITKSKSETKRLIRQKAIKLNQKKVETEEMLVKKNDILQIGKKKWFKIQ